MKYVLYASLAGLMTYFFTFLGALLVIFFKKENLKLQDILLALAAGIMLCSSYFSLLAPAIEAIKTLNISFMSVFAGFTLGGLALFLTDMFFSKRFNHEKQSDRKKRLFLLFTAITLHNIPEGLAVGVAFGSIGHGLTLNDAFMLALGIAIQNAPEGASISLPMKRDGLSTKKAFFFGQISGIVEPIASIIGAILVIKINMLMPFLLSFASGAMIYVTICEIIPESQRQNKSLSAFVTILGFAFMMILDSIN